MFCKLGHIKFEVYCLLICYHSGVKIMLYPLALRPRTVKSRLPGMTCSLKFTHSRSQHFCSSQQTTPPPRPHTQGQMYRSPDFFIDNIWTLSPSLVSLTAFTSPGSVSVSLHWTSTNSPTSTAKVPSRALHCSITLCRSSSRCLGHWKCGPQNDDQGISKLCLVFYQ